MSNAPRYWSPTAAAASSFCSRASKRSRAKSSPADRAEDATQLAAALLGQGKFREAVQYLEEARGWTAGTKPPENDLAWADRAVALAQLAGGDRDGYRATVEKMVRRYGTTTDVNTRARLAWVGGLAPAAPGWDPAAEAARLAAGLAKVPYPWGHRARALALFRAGNLVEAEVSLKKAAATDPRPRPVDSIILGLCEIKHGNAGQARVHLHRAEALLAAEKPSEAKPFAFAETTWDDRLTARILFGELHASVPNREVAPAPREK